MLTLPTSTSVPVDVDTVNMRTRAVRVRDPVRRARARLEAIGRAYIEFAVTEPGWFRTAFAGAG
jgi:hypothetical protein